LHTYKFYEAGAPSNVQLNCSYLMIEW